MADEEMDFGSGTGGDEEIIEKKPSAPTATVLMILTTVFIGFAIYLTGDELGYYFNKEDYKSEPQKRADYYYTEFKRRDAKIDRVEGSMDDDAPVGGR